MPRFLDRSNGSPSALRAALLALLAAGILAARKTKAGLERHFLVLGALSVLTGARESSATRGAPPPPWQALLDAARGASSADTNRLTWARNKSAVSPRLKLSVAGSWYSGILSERNVSFVSNILLSR